MGFEANHGLACAGHVVYAGHRDVNGSPGDYAAEGGTRLGIVWGGGSCSRMSGVCGRMIKRPPVGIHVCSTRMDGGHLCDGCGTKLRGYTEGVALGSRPARWEARWLPRPNPRCPRHSHFSLSILNAHVSGNPSNPDSIDGRLRPWSGTPRLGALIQIVLNRVAVTSACHHGCMHARIPDPRERAWCTQRGLRVVPTFPTPRPVLHSLMQPGGPVRGLLLSGHTHSLTSRRHLGSLAIMILILGCWPVLVGALPAINSAIAGSVIVKFPAIGGPGLRACWGERGVPEGCVQQVERVPAASVGPLP